LRRSAHYSGFVGFEAGGRCPNPSLEVLVSVRAALSHHRGAAGFAGGVLTCVALGSGVALAAVPSSATGSITACVSRTSGAVRIVDFQAGKRCTSRETTIAWSKGYRYRGAWSSGSTYAVLDVVTYNGASYLARVPSTAKSPTSTTYWGPLALRGLTGAKGTRGLQGVAGTAGAQGVPGVPGADGAEGAPGADGAEGPQGPTGPQGPAGVSGRVVVTVTADIPGGGHTLLDPQCPSGSVPIAGGAHVGSSFPGWGDANSAYIAESDLDVAGTGWASTVVVVSGASTTHFVAHVICVTDGS
jgi:hypothetical protein